MPQKLYEDIYSNERQFSFGENWASYLEHFSQERLEEAKASIQNLTQLTSLNGIKFLDIGCGSGLFSMAAHLLGAEVVSIDVDISSINCCISLRDKLKIPPDQWEIIQGSALDPSFIDSLDQFDIVYSWGVLHHTGDMWKAIQCASTRVKPDSLFILALYNKTDPLWIYSGWKIIKIIYNKSPDFLRNILIHLYSIMFLILRFKLNIFKFNAYKKDYLQNRGMHYLHDVIDWLGGYPYEVASEHEMKIWSNDNDMELIRSNLVPPTESGCNEFVMKKHLH